MIKNFLIEYFPWVGKIKRFFHALYHQLLLKNSYSQFGEDAYLIELIKKLRVSKYTYIDVGANHPTSISNTYLLYRSGMSGIVIEPNSELITLFKIFRKRDIPLQIGCSNFSSISLFHISKTPVISTFTKEHNFYNSNNIDRISYVPVMKLDDAISNLNHSYISLLNIDVEGWNKEVLMGAINTCEKAAILCIEFDSDDDLVEYKNILGHNFMMDRIFGCNVIFINRFFREDTMCHM